MAALDGNEFNRATGLVRGLGLWAATAVVIGAMIGSRSFWLPATCLAKSALSRRCWSFGSSAE